MSAKDFILDFINYLFIILLTVFCIFFFIDPERFAAWNELMRTLLPLFVFAIALLVKIKLSRNNFRQKSEEGSLEIVLYLSYLDKIKSDLVVFATPIIIFILPWLTGDSPGLPDFIQAAGAFLIMYSLQKNLFSKSR